MVFDLDLGTIRSTAQKHVATPGYMATAATLATVATKSAQSVAVVATVAAVASSHGLATHPQAPAPDPGHARLLTLAQAYCDRTGTSPAPAALPPTPPAPRVWLHLDAAWRRLDALYLAHHWQCTTCCTAGAGRGTRCDVGQRLHDQLAQAVRSA